MRGSVSVSPLFVFFDPLLPRNFAAVALCAILVGVASPEAAFAQIQLSASPNPNDGDFTLSWDAATGSVVYKVYEKPSSSSTWAHIDTTSTGSYDIVDHDPGSFDYRVQRCNTGGMMAGCSQIYSTTVTVTVYGTPLAPTGLTHPAIDFDGTYTISWDASFGATYYQLREQLWDSDDWETIHNAGGTSKTVAHTGGAREYKVRACNGNGCSAYGPVEGVTVVSTAHTLYSEVSFGSASRAGKTGFTAYVDPKGNARIDYPIRVPVGVNDLALPISLSYSSGGVPAEDEEDLPPSVLGHGWNIGGVPEITECNVNGAGYCLSGNKMVPVSGSGSTTVYRTEINTFTKLTSETSAAGTYYKAHLPDGRTMSFGKTSETRPGDGYKLDEITDPFGNQLTLTWRKVPEYKTSVLNQISYGGSEIHFRYGNRCPSAAQCDMPNNNGIGIPETVAQPLVLNRVLTKVSGKWVDDYRLDSNFDGDGYLRLVKVQHCARDESGSTTKCMAATQFGWEKLSIFDTADSSTSDLLVVETITDGYGDGYTFDYEVVNGSGSHALNFNHPVDFPNNTLPSNVVLSTKQRALVKSLDLPDGSGGSARTSYEYHGSPLYDNNGRGYLGFPVTSVLQEARPQFNPSSEANWNSDILTYTQFRLDFPYLGLVGRTMVRVKINESDGIKKKLSKTINRYADHTNFSGAVHFPHLDFSLTEQQEVLSDGTTMGYANVSKRSLDHCWRTLSSGNCPGSCTLLEYPTQLVTTTAMGLYLSGTDDDAGVYGHASTGLTLGGQIHVNSSVVDYENGTSPWVIGFVTRSESGWGTTSITETAETDVTRLSGSHRKPYTVNYFPGDAEYDRSLTFGYDSFGNVTSVTDTGVDQESATTGYSSFQASRYPQSQTNAAGHMLSLGYDLRFGTVDSITDPNSDTTNITRDEFGRITQAVLPDGTTVTTSFESCASGCSAVTWATPRMKVTRTFFNSGTQVSPDEVTYLDNRNLPLLVETQAFSSGDGWVRVQSHYDRWGRLTKRSLPYFSSGGTATFHQYFYDHQGRLVHESRPNSESIQRTIYADAGVGGHINIIVTETGTNRKKQYRFNLLGQLAQTTDGVGTAEQVTTSYAYTPRGDLEYIIVDGDQVATISYDTAGNRDYLTESSSGTSEFDYYSNHLLKETTDANSYTTRYEYDALGRLETRVDGYSSGWPVYNVWTWDTATNGIGRLKSRVNGPNAPASPEFSETYAYDGVGRVDSISTSIDVTGFDDNGAYVVDYGFDTYGRLSTIAYPNLTVTNVYTAHGYLSQVKNGSTILHEYTDVDAFGNILGEEYGNGLQTARTYDADTGELLTVQTGTSSLPKSIQDLVFEWQTDGALYRRIDKQGTSSTGDDLTETFLYDGNGRLESAGTASIGRDLTFDYDNHGNLLSKLSDISGDLDVSSYSYTTSGKPHRLNTVSIGGISNTLVYDSAGNITRYNAASGEDTYVGYDKGSRVVKITIGASSTDTTPTARDEFWYGPNGQRFLRKASWMDSSTLKESWTLYLYGGLFEENHPLHDTAVSYTQRVLVTGNVQHRYIKHPSSSTTSVDYLHRDHLGSVTAITQASGTIVEAVDYDPFGRQRETTWTTDITSANLADLALKEDSHTGRGFTDHEMLNRTGFVHMNGRVYDSRIGRFVQPDPIVGNPTIGDGHNRYAYVLNTPLSATDPTGFLMMRGDENDRFSISFSFGFSPMTIWSSVLGGKGTRGRPGGGRRGKSPLESLPDLVSAAWDLYGCVRFGLCAGTNIGSVPGLPGAIGRFGTGACGEIGGGSYCMSYDQEGDDKNPEVTATVTPFWDVTAEEENRLGKLSRMPESWEHAVFSDASNCTYTHVCIVRVSEIVVALDELVWDELALPILADGDRSRWRRLRGLIGHAFLRGQINASMTTGIQMACATATEEMCGYPLREPLFPTRDETDAVLQWIKGLQPVSPMGE